MSNVKKKDHIQFYEGEPDDEDLFVRFDFNLRITDTLIMYHVCHIYRRCWVLINEQSGMKFEDIPQFMTFDYVCRSVKEALDMRLQGRSSSYIDEDYDWCIKRPSIFDECLGYFMQIKKYAESIRQDIIKHKNFVENERIKSIDANID